MIQGFTETYFAALISTEDNRIDTSVTSTHIKYLVKFINDMDGSIDYCYPESNISNRYTKMGFSYVLVPDMYAGHINLVPAGHWKYEVYEVSWIGSVAVALGTAPATETDVLSVSDTNGVVQGIVTKGILNLTEKTGTEQVQYTQYPENAETNYVYYGVDVAPPPPPEFTFSVDTTNAGSLNTQFQLPLISNGTISIDVDWGDGNTDTITTYNQAETLHTYDTSGVYEIKIVNEVRGWQFNNGGDKAKITNISDWGSFNFTEHSSFFNCTILTCTATDVPTISTTDMHSSFSFCTLFNGSVSGWDVSAVTNFYSAFSSNTSFTGTGLDTWNVSSVTDFSFTFSFCSVMNADISSWNTSSVLDMEWMLISCLIFDQNISGWDINQVTNLDNILNGGELSTTNYDLLLVGWEVQAPNTGLEPNFGTSKYSLGSTAATAKASLVSTYNWVITDGGGI